MWALGWEVDANLETVGSPLGLGEGVDFCMGARKSRVNASIAVDSEPVITLVSDFADLLSMVGYKYVSRYVNCNNF